MQIKFDYYKTPEDTVELIADADMIEEAAAEVFEKYAKQEDGSIDLNEAIECVCGAFWKEGSMNALDCLTGEGSFWAYMKENTGFFESYDVQQLAMQKAIDEYKKLKPGEEN